MGCYRVTFTFTLIFAINEITFLGRAPNFTEQDIKRDETKVAEEYCWAITQTVGWLDWYLDCNWTAVFIVDRMFVLNSDWRRALSSHGGMSTSVFLNLCETAAR